MYICVAETTTKKKKSIYIHIYVYLCSRNNNNCFKANLYRKKKKSSVVWMGRRGKRREGGQKKTKTHTMSAADISADAWHTPLFKNHDNKEDCITKLRASKCCPILQEWRKKRRH